MLDYKKEKKQKQEMESYDEITQFIDTSIETNIMYFSPEFKEYVKQLESLQKALAQNEKILKKKHDDRKQKQQLRDSKQAAPKAGKS